MIRRTLRRILVGMLVCLVALLSYCGGALVFG